MSLNENDLIMYEYELKLKSAAVLVLHSISKNKKINVVEIEDGGPLIYTGSGKLDQIYWITSSTKLLVSSEILFAWNQKILNIYSVKLDRKL